MKYKTILLDIDDTIVDFEKSEELAFYKTFSDNNIKVDEKVLNNYKIINKSYWEAFEKGEITKELLTIERFSKLAKIYSYDYISEKINNEYLSNLALSSVLFDGAYEFLQKISNDFKIHIITNGVSATQNKKIEKVKIAPFIDKVITSEEAGANKPSVKFFEYAFTALNLTDKNDVIVIGDSLTADIKGAVDFGLNSCWFNIKEKTNEKGFSPTYEVKSYDEILKILY